MNSLNSNTMDMRDSFFNGLYKIVSSDKNVIVLTADHGAHGLNKISIDYPKQYFNVGIAEQNMISVAAGLALSGKIVYVYSIINFVTLRCLEQINIDIASMNLHVNIIGVGAGFTYSTDGPTHHGTQDVAIMSAIPNLSIYNCSDIVNTEAFSKISYEKKGPKYFRIEKGIFPNLYKKGSKFNQGIARIKKGDDIDIISSGYMIHKVVEVIKLLKKSHVNIGILDFYRLKPVNESALINYLSGTKKILVIEDNIATGGIFEKVTSILHKNRLNIDVKFLNLLDKFSFNYSQSRDDIESKSLLSVEHIMKLIIQ